MPDSRRAGSTGRLIGALRAGSRGDPGGGGAIGGARREVRGDPGPLSGVMLVLLLACNGADPKWDFYPLMSYRLADLPRPRVAVQLTSSQLTMTLDGELPCPIPIAGRVRGEANGVPMRLEQGAIHGTGLGAACVPTRLAMPLSEVPTGNLTITATDDETTWTVVLADPLAERTLSPGAAVQGGRLVARIAPPSDRWVAARPGEEPTRLLLSTQQPGVACLAEHEAPLPASPGEALEIDVPPDFCAGPAFLTLSTSVRRSAVLACPEGVSCRFDPGVFVAGVEVRPAPP